MNQGMTLKSYTSYLEDRGFNGYGVFTKDGSKKIGTVVGSLINDRNLALQYLALKPVRLTLRKNVLILLQDCQADYINQCFYVLNF